MLVVMIYLIWRLWGIVFGIDFSCDHPDNPKQSLYALSIYTKLFQEYPLADRRYRIGIRTVAVHWHTVVSESACKSVAPIEYIGSGTDFVYDFIYRTESLGLESSAESLGRREYLAWADIFIYLQTFSHI